MPDHPELYTYEARLENEARSLELISMIISKFPEIRAAVLLVGGFTMGRLQNTSDRMIMEMMSLNFFTAIHVVRPLVEYFGKRNEGGQFVFIGSRPGLEAQKGTDFFAYSFSKSMVAKLAEFINAEGKDRSISAAVIAPSTIDTDANRAAMPGADFTRWVPPQSIAETIAFILSDAGRMVHQPVIRIYNRS
jgi:NAD(P)-dependent dehydrogenase (short-subunit alcohol dehydrogenase family)